MHLFFAAAVIVAGVVLRVTQSEWCLLVLSMAAVLAAEMFNTAHRIDGPAPSPRRRTPTWATRSTWAAPPCCWPPSARSWSG